MATEYKWLKTDITSCVGLMCMTTAIGLVFVPGLHGVYGDGSASEVCPTFCKCAGTFRTTEVQCSGKNLTSVPSNLPRHIRSLDLSVNNITSIPDWTFQNYSSLTKLGLSSNKLTYLSRDSFAGLIHLETLSLQGNEFESVPPEAFRHLHRLQSLSLDANKISHVPATSFQNLRRLKMLRLEANLLTEVPVQSFTSLTSLEVLDLSVNKLKSIPDYAFSNMSNLIDLMLRDNSISDIGDYAFEGLNVLTFLYINRNRLKHIPSALISLSDLTEIGLEDNAIEFIPDQAFKENKKLEHIKLLGNPIGSYGKRAFRNLPYLKELRISEAREVTDFPDLTETRNLETIKLDRSGILEIPSNICHILPWLSTLDLHSNRITKIPVLRNCLYLAVLNLGNNEIKKLELETFTNNTSLKDLVLSHNSITSIPNGVFEGLYELQYLDMSNNKIELIEDEAFKDLTKLEDLNLSENQFPRLPTDGLQNLEKLKTFHNKFLTQPLPAAKFPKVQLLVLSYAYHCCNFINTVNTDEFDKTQVKDYVEWLEYDGNGSSVPIDETFYSDFPFQDIIKGKEDFEMDTIDDKLVEQEGVSVRGPVQCEPMPGPFLPCDDLFGWWSLRCGVWIVFLLAVAGNGIVLFVSISGRSKMDVPRFLICNLACADFCMGVYLGMLAIVDASTLGHFQQYAVRWQVSPGCLVAGFLGVFSSELSVLTLTVITLERYYAISHALQYSKRLTLRHAGFIMTGGWLFCIALSSLPLFNISDYRKFAICLPFETTETSALVYVCFIMLFNTFSFVVIVCCYIKIYVSILGSQAWNTKDFKVAKRMAVLVFTDFLCWSPIILFSITAAFGSELIGLNEAKVLTIFVLPLNSCANPFLYAIFTKQFKRDCVKLCKRIEESSISRSLSSLNSRRVSLGCGSSWRHSQLQSPFNTEKRSSCSNSLSGTSSSPGGLLNANDSGNMFARGKYFRKQSGDSLMGRSSISSDDRSDRPLRKNYCINVSPCKEILKETSNRTRKLSVGLAGSESQIVIHLGEKGNIKASDMLSIEDTSAVAKARHSKHPRSPTNPQLGENYSESAERPDSPPSISNLDSEGTTENVQMVESSQSKMQDLSAKEVFMKYKRNKELQAKREKRKEKRLTSAMLFRGSSAMNVSETDKNPVLHLPDKSNEPDKTSHINEWRKSSHLSFLWRNSLEGDGKMLTYKSNSLVELHRSSRDYETTPCKRRSLSSRHEGYILLKSNNRDSAYEDEDEMLEYEDNKEFSVNRCKQISPMPCSNSDDCSSNNEKRPKTDDSKEGEEKNSLLGSSPLNQPTKRGSCDKESGFGSENLVS